MKDLRSFDYSNFHRHEQCMIQIPVVHKDGQLGIGSGFHIGGGYILTARHVIETPESFELIPQRSGKPLQIDKVFYSSESNADVAVIGTNFKLTADIFYNGVEQYDVVTRFELAPTFNDWADSMQLLDVLFLGYPRIPYTKDAYLVAVKGSISAVVDPFRSDQVHFIVSSTARGGFSGGPCLMADWSVAGVCTEAFKEIDQPVESGFMAVVGLEPVYNLIEEHGLNTESVKFFEALNKPAEFD